MDQPYQNRGLQVHAQDSEDILPIVQVANSKDRRALRLLRILRSRFRTDRKV